MRINSDFQRKPTKIDKNLRTITGIGSGKRCFEQSTLVQGISELTHPSFEEGDESKDWTSVRPKDTYTEKGHREMTIKTVMIHSELLL